MSFNIYEKVDFYKKYRANINVLSSDFTDDIENIHIMPGRVIVEGSFPMFYGMNFAVFSAYGKKLWLVLFKKDALEPCCEIEFPKNFNIGHMFNMFIDGITWKKYEFCYRMDGEYNPKKGMMFNKNNLLLDPYASKISGRDVWGQPETKNLRCETGYLDFNWEDDKHLNIKLENLIVYEMHVRGFTAHSSSGVEHKGTFLGIKEKIPYFKELGINCIELMPIFEFDELQNTLKNPITGESLKNYWGYSTISFFAPKNGYAAKVNGDVIYELKSVIKELHANGIEVLLDVVFNHTAEMGNDGPVISFRGLDNKTYYMLDENGEPYNFSGCGNTLDCNNPVVRDYILNSLRFWASEYHIDGFRFDLASILSRDSNGNVLSNPPLIESITHDPVIGKCKLVAEPWDATGLYQLGVFSDNKRWTEWNGDYRDTIRHFLRGDSGVAEHTMQRIMGSPDLYLDSGRGPTSSINFICCHDGFTLMDLFSYDIKHNENNGENNKDGSDLNISWNCGVEGETDDIDIINLRKRMIKNALVVLFCSKGIPMLLMGDECGRTQKGNNNAYCQDNEISWFDWTLLEKNKDLFEFTKKLISLRKIIRLRHLLNVNKKDDFIFHGVIPYNPDLSYSSHSIAYHFECVKSKKNYYNRYVYIAINMYWADLEFTVPNLDCVWYKKIDTSKDYPEDMLDHENIIKVDDNKILVKSRSIVILVAQ